MGYDVLAIAPTSFFADYGCHVRILEEARALQRRGHRVTVCTYHNGRTPAGIRIRRMPRVPWHAEVRIGSHYHKLYFDALLAARSLLAAAGPVDVVHAHMHDGALIGYLVSRIRRVPLVFDYQGSLTREMIDHQFLRPSSPLFRTVSWLERTIDGLADVVLTSSGNAAALLQARSRKPGGRPGPAIEALPDGVDPHTFTPAPPADVAALRARYGIPAGRLVVGYIGLLAEYQGVGDLIFAARRIVERRPETHFLIMGYPGLERYQRQAHDLQILDRITFTGRVPYELAPLHLSLVDVAVSAKRSASEANGKLLNYMAMGLPTVAYDAPVAREIMGPCGVYASPGDIAALADAVISLLDDPDRRQRLGDSLRRRAVRDFSWDNAAAHLEGVYTRLTSGRRPASNRRAVGVEPAEPAPAPALAER